MTYTDPTGHFATLNGMSVATTMQGILQGMVSKLPCMIMSGLYSAKIGLVIGYITELASILDDIMLGRDLGNMFMRLQLTATVTALMSGMMGFIGDFCFVGLSAIPYIGPFASLAVKTIGIVIMDDDYLNQILNMINLYKK